MRGRAPLRSCRQHKPAGGGPRSSVTELARARMQCLIVSDLPAPARALHEASKLAGQGAPGRFGADKRASSAATTSSKPRKNSSARLMSTPRPTGLRRAPSAPRADGRRWSTPARQTAVLVGRSDTRVDALLGPTRRLEPTAVDHRPKDATAARRTGHGDGDPLSKFARAGVLRFAADEYASAILGYFALLRSSNSRWVANLE